jgi:uncharacterized membrane protein YeaQ/YmgE (transglycosylase-associated protein family)
MGIVGAVVGNLLLRLIGVGPAYGFIGNLLSATIGAVIVIMIYRAVTGTRRTY